MLDNFRLDTNAHSEASGEPSRLRRYVVAVIIAGIAVLVRWLVDPLLGDSHPFPISLLGVIGAAWYGGFGPAMTTVILTAIGGIVLFLPPRNAFNLQSPSDQIGLGVYLFCGVAAALIGEAQHRSNRRLAFTFRESERQCAELVVETARRSDIEEQVRLANADLNQARRRSVETLNVLDALVMNAPIGLALLDPGLRFVRINQFLAEGTGRSIADHIGRCVDAIVPNLPASIPAHARSVLKTAEPIFNRFVAIPHANGNESVWQFSYYPVKDANGQVFGIGIAALQITAQVEADRQLHASEVRFRLLTQAIPQLIWTADGAGRSTYFNRRWKEYTGLELELAKEIGWREVVHPDDADKLESAWQAAVTSREGTFMHEFRLRRTDGEFLWHLANAMPQRNSSGEIIEWVSALTDIDLQRRQADALERMVRERTTALRATVALMQQEVEERKRAEIKQMALTAELRRSNEELEQFAYVASHDLQEPLRKIRAFGDRLHAKFRDQVGPQGSDYIDRMQKSAARMQLLIDDLLTVSRVTTKAQPFAPVDLQSIVQGVLGDLEQRLTQTAGQVLVGALPTIEADASQMHQLLLNLIGNALKFHRPDVSPIVHVTAERIDAPLDGDPASDASAAICRIVVADNGIGFDELFRDRIFQMFQRLHSRDKFEGTGVGLAICRKIVERHGGTIRAHSRPDQGATFEVLLPAKRPLEETSENSSNAPQEFRRG
jgi:PAS domain S-box-containing protein